jgi:hypothetical protein
LWGYRYIRHCYFLGDLDFDLQRNPSRYHRYQRKIIQDSTYRLHNSNASSQPLVPTLRPQGITQFTQYVFVRGTPTQNARDAHISNELVGLRQDRVLDSDGRLASLTF